MRSSPAHTRMRTLHDLLGNHQEEPCALTAVRVVVCGIYRYGVLGLGVRPANSSDSRYSTIRESSLSTYDCQYTSQEPRSVTLTGQHSTVNTNLVVWCMEFGVCGVWCVEYGVVCVCSRACVRVARCLSLLLSCLLHVYSANLCSSTAHPTSCPSHAPTRTTLP